ncbi:MAG TPA: polysaccharide biosynthesis-like protein [Dehalococcoidia bacterium]|nr:polysaccharide biosynthesis-like protein [Dehalococcoidia bacterium]
MKRVAVFAHFDRDNIVDDYVLYYLEQLRHVAHHIVFVTASQINQPETARVSKLCDAVIVRENIGYDFASWRAGINSITNLADYDELILCNDSVYGPLFPLQDSFARMQEKQCDFWGMTDNYEIAYHLQSYFLVFRKNVFISKAFTDFWNSLDTGKTKWEIIREYEIGLSQVLMTAGFKPCVYAPAQKASLIKLALLALQRPSRIVRVIQKKKLSRNLNQTQFFWHDLIIKYKMPFIKIELLRDNPAHIDVTDYKSIINEHSCYNIRLIEQHLERINNDKE